MSVTGLVAWCSDGELRNCFPIISNIIADYEEAVLVTGIKSGRQCCTCQVPPDERENLEGHWPPRTHENMKAQIRLQRQGGIAKGDDNWVYDIDNFGWYHPHWNVYEGIAVDILHQLFKGIVQNLIDWIQNLLSDRDSGVPRKKKRKDRIGEEDPAILQLDNRFRNVPRFTGLKHFDHFSHVQQWTGEEQKAVLRILIPVVSPLLKNKHSDAIACARAIADFVTIVQYRAHDEHTLSYMQDALHRIYMTRMAFRNQRPRNDKDAAHWNYPKWHAMIHYKEFIEKYGAPDGFNSDYMETAHKTLLKAFYNRTNKGEDYLLQIARHNSRQTSLLAMKGIISYYKAQESNTETLINAQVTTMSQTPIQLEEFNWNHATAEEKWILLQSNHNPKTTITARRAQEESDLVDFVDALAVFVRAYRREVDGERVIDERIDYREESSTWVEDFPIQFFGSIKCWKRTGKNYANTEELEHEYLRCSPR